MWVGVCGFGYYRTVPVFYEHVCTVYFANGICCARNVCKMDCLLPGIQPKGCDITLQLLWYGIYIVGHSCDAFTLELILLWILVI